MNNRLRNFQKNLFNIGLGGFIVTNPYNIFYLTGFIGVSPQEREAILILNPRETLIAPKLYQAEAHKIKSKGLHIKIVRERNEILETAKKLLSKCKKIGFEEENLTFSEYKEFKKTAPPGAKLVPVKNLAENMRIIKSSEEIKAIERAQVISQKAFAEIVKTLKVGQTEEEIAHHLKSIIQHLGGQGLAFESIVASGRNSGLPHHVTGKRRLAKNDILLLDFGAKYQNYCADLTRMVAVGKLENHIRNILTHVLEAQHKALSSIAQNIKSKDAYLAANNYFKKHKLHNNFTHGLGHGVGLEVHEAPHLRLTIDDPLTEGMVFSIEPGLYFPWGGVRIEDLITIQNGSAKVLGKTVEEVAQIRL